MTREELPWIGIELIDEPGWMGGTLYLKNLARCLACLPEEERPRLSLLGDAKTLAAFSVEYPQAAAVIEARKRRFPQSILGKLGWMRERLPAAPQLVYPGFGPSLPGARTLRWIPDFQHRYLPDLFSEEERRSRDDSIGAIAASDRVVVVSSEVAAADFKRFFADACAEPHVWRFHSHLSIDSAKPEAEPLRRMSVPQKFLYVPNQFWAHKNHETAFRALGKLKRDFGLDIPLVCTGAQSDRRNRSHFDQLMAIIKEEGVESQVFMLGLLPRAEQIAVLRLAAAIVQPSRFEGWSTVVEDAKALGRPVFLSNLAVHIEQAPEHAQFFAPDDPDALAALIAEAWEALRPGPDPEAEALAARWSRQQALASGRKFVEIARAALAGPDSTLGKDHDQ